MKLIQRDSNLFYSQPTTYEEINLPFDHLDDDNIKGGELYESISSNALDGALRDYVIEPDFSEDEYLLSARTEFPSDRAAQNGYGEIEIRIEPEAEYSHLRLKASGNSEEALEETLEDLEGLEQDLENHFREELITPEPGPVLKYKATD